MCGRLTGNSSIDQSFQIILENVMMTRPMQPMRWVRLGAKQGAASNTDVARHRKTNSLSKSLGKKIF
jgi:hypothetical protein